MPSLDSKDDLGDTPDVPVIRDLYEPTVLDVIVVKAMLQTGLGFPPEIIDSIVDLAEYWPHTSTEVVYANRPNDEKKNAYGSSDLENQFLLRTPPLGFIRSPYSGPGDIEALAPPQPLEEEFEPQEFQDLIQSPIPTVTHPCRKIVFTTVSRDQGWGGVANRGTYYESWTWFEAGLERCNKKALKTANDSKNDFEPVSGSESKSTEQAGGPAPNDPSHPSFALSNLASIIPNVETNPDSGDCTFAHPLHPRQDCMIQCNVAVDRHLKEHRVVWSYTDNTTASKSDGVPDSPEIVWLVDHGRGKRTGDGEFIRNLKLGDVVTVWAKARFPGWTNFVDRVKVDVYWVV